LTNGHIDNDRHYLFNETVPYTKRKFLSKSKNDQRKYMILKNPFVFFGIVPVLYFLITQRYVFALKKYKLPSVYKQSLFQIIMVHMINNVLSGMYLYQLYQYEILPHFFVFLSLGCSLAFMLFHNQHTFNPSYVVKEWSQRNSGIKGSSFIQIPWFLKYFFMGIEYHHIHHMYSKLPGYNLQKYHEETQHDIVEISMRECYHNLWLVLYDEEKEKYITFNELDDELHKLNLIKID
jgi:omega-6 fatty acid desaturase (delta-12 desaturase)